MAIPPLDANGLLPPGVYGCTLEEIEDRLGGFQLSDRRIRLFAKLRENVREVQRTGLAVALRHLKIIPMRIRHDQFLQDVEVIEMMYRSLDGLRHDRIPKSRQWHALMAAGPMDEIRTLQAEMHEYLNLPYPLPAVGLPTTADAARPVASGDDFQLALEQLCRLYRALGSLYLELAQFRPRLVAALADQVLPVLQATQSSMDNYLEWAAIEETLGEMDRKFGGATSPSFPVETPGTPQLSEEKP